MYVSERPPIKSELIINAVAMNNSARGALVSTRRQTRLSVVIHTPIAELPKRGPHRLTNVRSYLKCVTQQCNELCYHFLRSQNC